MPTPIEDEIGKALCRVPHYSDVREAPAVTQRLTGEDPQESETVMRMPHKLWIGLSALACCGLVVLPVAVHAAEAPASESVAKQAFGDDQIRVHVGEPFVISKSTGHHWFPTLKQVRPEHLFVGIWAAADAAMSEQAIHTVGVWTCDGGRTWGEPVSFRGKQAGGHSWIRRNDGTCVWLSYFTRTIDEKTATCNVGRSQDGRTYSWSEGKVTFPQAVNAWKDGNSQMVFARSILQRSDGALLASMYGRFVGDKRYRSILVRSTDGGVNWQYFSTMAYDPNADGEGLCEPSVIELAGGDLFCIMRIGSGKPMYAVRSSDGGSTWTTPVRLGPHTASVFPDLVLMSNGILACSFGRPGCHLMFSVDGKGDRWTKRTTIFEGSSTSYTAIREVAPGRLLYVHDVVPAGWNQLKPGQFNEIRGVFVTVTKTGV